MWKDQCVIITGGSSGIGACMATRLAAQGARIALLARDQAKLSRVRDEIASATGADESAIRAFSCDITSIEHVNETVARMTEAMGRPDALVNSAGILSGAYFEHTSLDNFRALMDTNFFGALHCIKAVLPLLKKKSKARIINIASAAGVMGVFGYTSYCASKHAVVGFTEALRQELLPQGIAVHLVVPPQVQTPMLEAVEKDRPVENRKLAESVLTLSVEETADYILKGIRRGRAVIAPGFRARVMIKVAQAFPGMSRKVSDAIVKRHYRGPGE